MPQLATAIDEYLDWCKARKHPYGTWANRRTALYALLKVAGNVPTTALDSRHVQAMFGTNPHWGFGHSNNMLSALMLFFKWCRHKKYMAIDSDPLFGWKFWEYEPAEKMRIPFSEWPKLFAACESQLETITIATGLFLFLRASEQKCLQVKKLRLNEAQPKVVVYRPKTRRTDVLPVSHEMFTHFKQHLTWMSERGELHPDYYLIHSRTRPSNGGGGKFTKGHSHPIFDRPYNAPTNLVQAVLERAGYPTFGEGEHTLRRSGARAYFDSLSAAGYDGALRRVQWFLGHKSSAMTERYLGLSLERFMVEREVAGQPMFGSPNTNVVQIRSADHG